jgi:hypothetical protein
MAAVQRNMGLEREMSLPTGEQQILDRIDRTLQVSEPRLASMFAIFGRLVKNDGPPLRERLPVAGSFPLLAGFRRLSRSTSSRSTGSRSTGSGSTGSGSTGSGSTGSRRASRFRDRRIWQLVFVVANVVAAVVLVSVLIALNTHTARSCPQHPQPSAPVFESHNLYCPAQSGSSGTQQQR